jgi:protein-S-isoprenylcysteine O-methyltransferase Ste14
MLLSQTMRDTGRGLFRWRSYVLLVFLPLIAVAVMRGEPIERALGEVWGGLYEATCVAIVAAGLALRAFTVGFVPARTSGRNTRDQVADSLNTTGMYSLSRNPLYLANGLIYMGVMLYTQDLLLSLAFAFFLCIYYERIILAEEAFLVDRFGEAYLAWVAEVPVLLPRLSGWRAPAMRFSLRTVVRREYTTWLAAIVALGVVDMSADWFGQVVEVDIWRWLIAAALVLYGTIHLVKRHTRLLAEPGR